MKDMLLFDDPQTDEFIENFKTPPIPPIEFKKIRKRQANDYIFVCPSPWPDCLIADVFLYKLAQFHSPTAGRAGSAETAEARGETYTG